MSDTDPKKEGLDGKRAPPPTDRPLESWEMAEPEAGPDGTDGPPVWYWLSEKKRLAMVQVWGYIDETGARRRARSRAERARLQPDDRQWRSVVERVRVGDYWIGGGS